MDIVLERILSLLPHDETGKIVRGAKKDFAVSLGYDSGDIVSMWIKGTSTSYKNKLHEIASKYNVSVAWLKGETDDPGIKKDLTENGEVGPGRKRLFDLINSLDDAQCDRFAEAIEALTRKGSE